MIDTELVASIADALTEKWANACVGSHQELIESIILTTVCDTAMILDGTVPLEAFQVQRPHTQEVCK